MLLKNIKWVSNVPALSVFSTCGATGWEENPAARVSASAVVELLAPLHDIHKCTDPNKNTGCGCAVM